MLDIRVVETGNNYLKVRKCCINGLELCQAEIELELKIPRLKES